MCIIEPGYRGYGATQRRRGFAGGVQSRPNNSFFAISFILTVKPALTHGLPWEPKAISSQGLWIPDGVVLGSS